MRSSLSNDYLGLKFFNNWEMVSIIGRKGNVVKKKQIMHIKHKRTILNSNNTFERTGKQGFYVKKTAGY